MWHTDSSVRRYLDDLAREPTQALAGTATSAGAVPANHATATDRVRQNLRFVVMVAKRYRNMGLPLADLICEGNAGLVEAARRYDPERGVKFISYAVWWVRHAILKALAENTRVVRPPTTITRALLRRGRATCRLEQELGRAPGVEELAAALGIAASDVPALGPLEAGDMSLDPAPPGDEHVWWPGEYLADTLTDDGEQLYLQEEMRREVRRAVNALPPVEMQVLSMYFGLASGESMTLEQIGAHLQRSRERIRQVKHRALQRLSVHSRGLHDYLQSD
jgi:RNA polymerase primary sigma factor